MDRLYNVTIEYLGLKKKDKDGSFLVMDGDGDCELCGAAGPVNDMDCDACGAQGCDHCIQHSMDDCIGYLCTACLAQLRRGGKSAEQVMALRFGAQEA